MSSVSLSPWATSLVVSAATAPQQPAGAARRLGPQERLELALESLGTGVCISGLARDAGVSRKFIYQQQCKALLALDGAFWPPPPPPSPSAAEEVLFFLPVTRSWLRQLVLALILICHCSIRGVHELLRDLLNYDLSIGSIHNITQEAITKVAENNARENLSAVDCAVPDEIFVCGSPVLCVADARSSYCRLLSLEEHRDSDTWGVRYLELKDKGLDMRLAVADMGKGQRSGLKEAYPDVDCRADVFHPERDLGKLARFLENKAFAALKDQVRLEQEQTKRPQAPGVAERLALARAEADHACALADDVRTLACWLCRDVLCLSGPPLTQRRELLELVIEELKRRRERHERLDKMWRSLESQKEKLLLFVFEMDRDITALARNQDLPEEAVRKMAVLQETPRTSPEHWRLHGELRALLGGQHYQEMGELVKQLRQSIVRASSCVENLNSRLRNYFHLRREVGGGYLQLLRFFLNHRRFLRSERPERAGKSPKEVLTGQAHPHWLEMLGFSLFKRPA
jgi:hypothetical protein